MEEKEKLTIQDAENAQKGVLALAMAYPDYPKLFKADNTTIRWNSVNTERSIGLFPMQGAVYLKKYVSELDGQRQLCGTDAISDGL